MSKRRSSEISDERDDRLPQAPSPWRSGAAPASLALVVALVAGVGGCRTEGKTPPLFTAVRRRSLERVFVGGRGVTVSGVVRCMAPMLPRSRFAPPGSRVTRVGLEA